MLKEGFTAIGSAVTVTAAAADFDKTGAVHHNTINVTQAVGSLDDEVGGLLVGKLVHHIVNGAVLASIGGQVIGLVNSEVYDTEAKLKAVVSAATASTGAGTELTVNAGKINAGDSIRVGDKTYTFGDGAGKIALGTNGADAGNGVDGVLDGVDGAAGQGLAGDLQVVQAQALGAHVGDGNGHLVVVVGGVTDLEGQAAAGDGGSGLAGGAGDDQLVARTPSTPFPASVPIWVPSRTVWSTPSTTWMSPWRTCSVYKMQEGGAPFGAPPLLPPTRAG